MGKVAVIASGDPEHSEEIKERAHQPIEHRSAGKNRRQRQKMHDDETDLRLQQRFISLFKGNWNFHFFLIFILSLRNTC